MKRVLLVDDDEDLLQTLASALEDGYELELASSGEIALAKVLESDIDAMIIDMMMPVMDGPELIAALRRQGNTTPVIVMSADVDVHSRAASIGAADCVSKPFDLDDIEAKLARVLGERS